MTTRSITFTRTSLSLADLVITDDPNAGDFWLPEEGLEEPDVTYRYTYMPDSRDIAGSELVQAVQEHSRIPVLIYVKGTDAAALKANKQTLRDALGQFSYTTTLDIDGEVYAYRSDPTAPRFGPVDSGMVRQRIARASVVIPVYPIAGVGV